MFRVVYHPEARDEIRALPAFHRTRILDAIEVHLFRDPRPAAPRKKLLLHLNGIAIYQLRVGEYRVFYTFEEALRIVAVRHVRRKGRKTTGEIL